MKSGLRDTWVRGILVRKVKGGVNTIVFKISILGSLLSSNGAMTQLKVCNFEVLLIQYWDAL